MLQHLFRQSARLPFLLILFGCLIGGYACSSTSNNLDIRNKYPPAVQVFTSPENQRCMTICPLGIETGATSDKQLLQILHASSFVDQATITETGTEFTWFPESTHEFQSYARIAINQGRVTSINLNYLAPFTVKDFITLFGEPLEISIRLWNGEHGEIFTYYSLYYPDEDFVISIVNGKETGPRPDDFVTWLGAGKATDDKITVKRQVWLGYGHISEYLP